MPDNQSKRIPEISSKRREQILSYVTRTDEPTECWRWEKGKDKNGYGITTVQNRPYRAHRIAYFLHYGVDPSALCVLHRCDNPSCCNPAHLFLGTNEENTADRHAKGRSCSGDRHPVRLHPEKFVQGSLNGRAKLTEEQVREIRRLFSCGLPQAEIGRRFFISKDRVWHIIHKVQWKHVL